MGVGRAKIDREFKLLAATAVFLPARNKQAVHLPAIGADVRLQVVELFAQHIIHARSVGILLPNGALVFRFGFDFGVVLLPEIG